MNKLYVGNLPADVTESKLQKLFQDHSLSFTTIVVKHGGHAFVTCHDQSTADRAIDKLNGYNFMGYELVVEPALTEDLKKKRDTCRIMVNNVPSYIEFEELEPLLSSFGSILSCMKMDSHNDAIQILEVIYENKEQAHRAAIGLDGYVHNGITLNAEARF